MTEATEALDIERTTATQRRMATPFALGGATSEITGGFGALLRFDAVGAGTIASPATVNLGNTYFRGVAGTSVQKTDIEFAPDNTFTFLRADATNTHWDTATGPGVNVPAASLTLVLLRSVARRRPASGATGRSASRSGTSRRYAIPTPSPPRWPGSRPTSRC